MEWIGELSALATAALWAVTSLLFTSAVGRVGAMQVNISRLVVAALLLAATIAAAGLPLGLTARQAWLLVASGVVGLVFGDSFLFKAFHLVGARTSMLIMSLAPALAAVMAYVFLGETLSGLAVAGTALTLAGVVAVVWERSGPPDAVTRRRPVGVVFALFGALGQAGNLVLAKLAFREGPIDDFVASFVRIAASVCLLVPAAALAGSFRAPWRVFRADRRALVLVLLASVGGSYLGITLSLVAVKHADVGIAATIMATVPILMLPMARFLERERVSWRAVSGAFVAVAGVAILFLL